MKKKSLLSIISSENNRLILLNLLDGKKTPKTLTSKLGISYQDLSNRLKILLESELIIQEPSGREIFYSRNKDKIDELRAYFDFSLGLNLNSLKEYHENSAKWSDKS